MSNDSRTIKNEKKTTPVTIVPAKASLRKINRKVEPRYRHWLDIQKLRKQYLKKNRGGIQREERKNTCFANNKK